MNARKIVSSCHVRTTPRYSEKSLFGGLLFLRHLIHVDIPCPVFWKASETGKSTVNRYDGQIRVWYPWVSLGTETGIPVRASFVTC